MFLIENTIFPQQTNMTLSLSWQDCDCLAVGSLHPTVGHLLWWISIPMMLSLPILVFTAASHKCSFPIVRANVGGTCTSTWQELQQHLYPTQNAVGFAWVHRKIENDFSSASDAQDAMDSEVLPVALGPGGHIYLLDHHHTLAALDYSDYPKTKATVFISCDFSNETSARVWPALIARALAYPFGRPMGTPDALPTPVSESSIPTRIVFRPGGNTTFTDDRWRALSSFVRKVKGLGDCPKGNKYCMRGYNRACASSGSSIPFFEFRWAYLMNDAYLHAGLLWDNQTAALDFKERYKQLDDPTNVKRWQDAADALVYLCRGLATAIYKVPSTMGAMSGVLPGVVTGMDPIEKEDPDCDPPRCA